MSVKQTLITKIAAQEIASGIDYASQVAVNFVKTASGVTEMSAEDAQKVAESLYTPVVLAGLAKLSAK